MLKNVYSNRLTVSILTSSSNYQVLIDTAINFQVKALMMQHSYIKRMVLVALPFDCVYVAIAFSVPYQ